MMMLNNRPAAIRSMGGRSSSSLTTAPAAGALIKPQQRQVVVRFRDEDRSQAEVQTQQQRRPTNPRASPQQVEEVFNKEEGNFSPRTAEIRADLGSAATDLSTMQTFDGSGPETINSRLAMLGVLTGLLGEWFTGKGLLEQTADHPVAVFASFVIISIATYVPIFKGYTRKEPFANNLLGLNWTPKAENWNGRLAMIGFTGMILTEAIAGCNTLQAWGLQPHVLGSVPGIH